MKRLIIFGLIIITGLALLAGAALFLLVGYFSTTSEQASGPITAPVLASSDPETTTFQIVPEESEARFFINEVLRGDPITVVGKTDQVAGQIAVDRANPTNTIVG